MYCITCLHDSPVYQQLGHFPIDVCIVEVWITELTLIHKNITSVRNSHAQELTLMLKILRKFLISTFKAAVILYRS